MYFGSSDSEISSVLLEVVCVRKQRVYLLEIWLSECKLVVSL